MTMISTAVAILQMIGNVDHSAGGGENTARVYGGMLNDIRTLLEQAVEADKPHPADAERSEFTQSVMLLLRRERDRLNAIESPTPEDDERLSACVEFIKNIRQSDERNGAILKIDRQFPTRLAL